MSFVNNLISRVKIKMALFTLLAASATLGIGGFILFLVVLLKSDCNLLLKLAEKYGKSPSILKGKVCWITGASSGIGEHLAYEFASHGVKLVLSSRRRDQLEEVKRKCLISGPLKEEDVLIIPLNVQEDGKHAECVKTVLDHFGQIDILVNNAGRSQRAQFMDIELAVDRELFETNVFGAVSLTRHVLKHMLERGSGKIAVTSSVTGKMGAPNSATYTASKHALHGYFECLRTEITPQGIDICVVCPGPVFSGIVENAATGRPGEVFGERQNPTDKRMLTSRCAQLMAIAIANNLHEVWISLQPVLLTYYLAQYTPTLWTYIMSRAFAQRICNRVREGR